MLLLLCLLVTSLTLSGSSLLAGKPASGMHPIVDLSGVAGVVRKPPNPHTLEAGSLFGARVDGKWVDGTTLASKLASGQAYRLYSRTQLLGIATAGKPTVQSDDDAGDFCPELILTLPRGMNPTQTLLGIAGKMSMGTACDHPSITKTKVQTNRLGMDETNLAHPQLRFHGQP
jgi:hypothetical protein